MPELAAQRALALGGLLRLLALDSSVAEVAAVVADDQAVGLRVRAVLEEVAALAAVVAEWAVAAWLRAVERCVPDVSAFGCCFFVFFLGRWRRLRFEFHEGKYWSISMIICVLKR